MVSVRTLTDKQQTGDEMARLVRRYSTDLHEFTTPDGTPLLDLPLYEYYITVRDIPYNEDRHGVEIITRPWHMLSNQWEGLDCKKKAILIAAYLQEHGIPWRFAAVSSRRDGRIHHVLVEAKMQGEWVEVDATYPENQLGEVRNWNNRELLSGAKSEWADKAVLVSMYGEGDVSQYDDQQFDHVRSEMDMHLGGEPLSAAASVVGIIVAIVAACAGVAAIIVSAVQANRSEERAYAFQTQQIADARTYAEQQQSDAAAAAEVKRQKDEELLVKIILPVSLGAGALLYMANRKAA